MTPTNINFTPKKICWCGQLAGMEVRMTPDVKLGFVGFIRFVGFNLGHVQFLRFVVVMVRSYSCGHLDSVK